MLYLRSNHAMMFIFLIQQSTNSSAMYPPLLHSYYFCRAPDIAAVGIILNILVMTCCWAEIRTGPLQDHYYVPLFTLLRHQFFRFAHRRRPPPKPHYFSQTFFSFECILNVLLKLRTLLTPSFLFNVLLYSD